MSNCFAREVESESAFSFCASWRVLPGEGLIGESRVRDGRQRMSSGEGFRVPRLPAGSGGLRFGRESFLVSLSWTTRSRDEEHGFSCPLVRITSFIGVAHPKASTWPAAQPRPPSSPTELAAADQTVLYLSSPAAALLTAIVSRPRTI